MKILDMNGKPCPIPVINAKRELGNPGADGVTVLVDNIVAVQNLQKMAQGTGRSFSYEQHGEGFKVEIRNQGVHLPAAAEPSDIPPPPGAQTDEGVTVLITCDQMGRGSEELGRILIKGFLFSLTELAVTPKSVIFLNSGVRLATDGSNTLADLRALSDKGVRIMSCGTCLNYYSLTDKLAVGEVSDMLGITENIASASKLITL